LQVEDLRAMVDHRVRNGHQGRAAGRYGGPAPAPRTGRGPDPGLKDTGAASLLLKAFGKKIWLELARLAAQLLTPGTQIQLGAEAPPGSGDPLVIGVGTGQPLCLVVVDIPGAETSRPS
jgi:hypothetical protein